MSRASAVIFVGLLTASSASGACDERGGGRRETPAAGATTFNGDIAPIVFSRCAPCHRPGQAAPFSLLSYQEVRARARIILDVTQRRYMPPWLPVPGHGDFVGERRLTNQELEAIGRWVEGGTVEGSAKNLPPLPAFSDDWQLGPPDLVLEAAEPYRLAAEGSDVWRNFVIPNPLDTGQYVRAIELRPGSTSFVHHALLGVDATSGSRRRDAQDRELGFAGMDMGSAQAPEGHLLGWTPGMAPFPGVPGKAWHFEPGADVVLQLHMIPSGRTQPVTPAIGLYFATAPRAGPSLALIRLDADHLLDIPPGEKRFIVSDTFDVPTDVDLLAIYPHAHQLARRMEAVARFPDGTARWLLRIDDWDFRWQDIYRYAAPVALPRGTVVSMRYVYDNSAENPRNPHRPPRRVMAGLASTDEMAHLQLQVAGRKAEDTALLREAMYRRSVVKYPSDAWGYYELGNALRDRGDVTGAIRYYRAGLERDPRHAVTHNNLGVLLAEAGQTDAAIAHYRQALAADPDLADAHYNLGNALRSRRVDAAAIDAYREALRLEPRFAEASNNLGEALASQARFLEAIAEFRRAVRLKPQSAEAHNNLGAGLGRIGRFDEAIQHFEEAIRHDPTHAAARANLQLAREAAGKTR